MRRPTCQLLAGLAMLAGCSDETLERLEPRIEVEPMELDFGAGCVGEDNVLDLTIRNLGVGRLELSKVELTSGGAVFAADLDPTTLEVTDELTLPVVFVPTTPKQEYAGTLRLSSNDPRSPELEVPLSGVGGIREIEVVPTEVDFGIVNEGLAPTRTVEIRNLGGDPLVIDALTWTSTSVDLAPVGLPPLPLVVPAKTSTAMRMRYRPEDLGADAGTLTIESNDEDEPVVEVSVRAAANLAPRALAWICDAVADEPGCPEGARRRAISAGLGRIMGIDGRDSFDPEGGALRFSWDVLEAPPDQDPVLFFGSEDIMRGRSTGEVEVPRVGRYVLRLVARDDRGLESFDLPESRVTIRPKDLEVYLRWNLATDVDLHLVRPGGQVGDYGSGRTGTSTGSDCSAFNRSPNWGDPASPYDDPSLERDVVSGRGPEVVSLESPEAGVYRAYVHYCDSRHVNTNVYADVEVYVRGELAARVPVMDGARMLPGELWEAALVEWDTANETAVVTEGTAEITSRPDLCIIPE